MLKLRVRPFEARLATALVEELLARDLSLSVLNEEGDRSLTTTVTEAVLEELGQTTLERLLLSDEEGRDAGFVLLAWGEEEDLPSIYTPGVATEAVAAALARTPKHF